MPFKQDINDKRKGIRLDFVTDVVVMLPDYDRAFHGRTCNICISGMLVECEDMPTVHSPCSIQIVIPGRNSRLLIDDLTGTVVRTKDGRTTIVFTEPLEWLLLFHVYQHKLAERP
ncbi:MAG: hypothetical protein GQ559_06000 [Desulfobulbaceae bacterium]|nr:hypothetical protein [Desulfobulbaceae bacterium]